MKRKKLSKGIIERFKKLAVDDLIKELIKLGVLPVRGPKLSFDEFCKMIKATLVGADFTEIELWELYINYCTAYALANDHGMEL